MKNFNEVSDEVKRKVLRNYVIPCSTANIHVNDKGQAFQTINGSKVGLTLKPSAIVDSFHNYANKQA